MGSYLINPLDILIFGDGKPFNAGEQHNREINFFLNPVPFVSAFNKYTGLKTGLNFLSLYDKQKQDFLFPVPLDIGFEENGEIITSSLKKSNDDFVSSEEIDFFIEFKTNKKMKVGGKYINTEGLKNYLIGEDIDKNNIYNLYGKILETEVRTGIQIERISRTTKEKMLFFQPFIRFCENFKFFVKYKQDIDKEFLTLGGESKAVNVFPIFQNSVDSLKEIKASVKEKIEKDNLFKIILLTPTNYPPEIEGAKLIAKVVGKHITYSGWINWLKEKGFPSRIFRLIPEGSVFYYRLEDKNKLDEIFENYWLKPSFYIHELPYFDRKNPIGFGLTIIGAIHLEE